MDWDGLCVFLKEIKGFLEQVKAKSDQKDTSACVVNSLIEKCEFYLSTVDKRGLNDEVDEAKGGTYLNMIAANQKILTIEIPKEEEHEFLEQSEYIDMDDYGMKSVPPSPTKLTPAECPYMGLPYAHLKLNKSVLIVQEQMKISGKKSTVTCALLKGSWLLYYSSNKPNALKPSKFFQIEHLEIAQNPALELTLYCTNEAPQTLHFDSGTVREMWIRTVREELPTLEDGVYDDPNNLRMDDHLYKTMKFEYDIPKMPPKPIVEQQQQQLKDVPAEAQQTQTEQRMSQNRAEFQLKYQEIKEQLAAQLMQQKAGGAIVSPQERVQRTNSIASPQKKFGRFMNMFRSGVGATSPPLPPLPPMPDSPTKKSPPEKTAKIMKYKRTTTIFSPEYEIVGS